MKNRVPVIQVVRALLFPLIALVMIMYGNQGIAEPASSSFHVMSQKTTGTDGTTTSSTTGRTSSTTGGPGYDVSISLPESINADSTASGDVSGKRLEPTVTMISGVPAYLAVPSTVTLPSTTSSKSFLLKSSRPPKDVLAAVSVTGRSTTGAMLTKSARITIKAWAETVALSPSSVVGGIATPVTGTVTLPQKYASAIVLSLASSDSSVVVPPNVIVAAGTLSSTFPIRTNFVATSKTVTITTSIGAVAYASASLTVTPASIGVTPSTTVGGTLGTVIGTVTLPQKASTAMVFELTCSQAVVGVPKTVTIPAGSLFANFPITTGVVSWDKEVTIAATLDGEVYASTVLTLSPIAVHTSFSSTTVKGGGTIQMNFVLNAAVSVPTSVNLSFAPNGVVEFGSSITIPAGQNNLVVSAVTQTVKAATSVKLTPEIGVVRQASATLLVTP